MFGSNYVPPDGDSNASILFLGEAPGETENRLKVPFTGRVSGQLLNRSLRAVGLKRSEVLVWNVFPYRPPGNDITAYFEDRGCTYLTAEGQEFVTKLKTWIESKADTLNIIVALGAIPLKILTGKEGITKWRGSVLPCTLTDSNTKVYAMNHPSAVSRSMQEKEDSGKGVQNLLYSFMIDLRRVKTQSITPDYPDIKYDFTLDPSVDESIHLLRQISESPEQIATAVDIETIVTSTYPVIWKIGFSMSSSKAFSIPFLKNGTFCMTEDEEAAIIVEISKVFLAPHVTKIFQSNLFDLNVLGAYYGLRVAKGTLEDTRWLHHSIAPSTLTGLDFLASIYTWQPYYKNSSANILGTRSDLEEAEYNCIDCCVTHRVFQVASQKAKEVGTWSSYKQTMSIMSSTLSMMLKGVRIDQEAKIALREEYSLIIDNLQKEVEEYLGHEVNLKSSQQKIVLLYGRFGMNKQVKSYGKVDGRKMTLRKVSTIFDKIYAGHNHSPENFIENTKSIIKLFKEETNSSLTSNKDAINKLVRMFPEEKFLYFLRKYQTYSILVNTFLSMPISPNGRVYTTYNFTTTLRLRSSRNPFGFGGNLQNIPKRKEEGKIIRKLFVPDPGYTMISVDGSQAEARVVAYESEDIEDIEAFNNPEYDIHWERAKMVFNLDKNHPYEPEELIEVFGIDLKLPMKKLRDMSKIVVHGTNYAMTKVALQNNLIDIGLFLKQSECNAFLERYRYKKPKLVAWQMAIKNQVSTYRYLDSAIGVRRWFHGRLNDSTYRAAFAFSPQNTVGRWIQLGTENIYDRHGYIEPLLNVHDELISQVPLGSEDRAIKDITECMRIPIRAKGREFVIPCDFKLSSVSWGDMKGV